MNSIGYEGNKIAKLIERNKNISVLVNSVEKSNWKDVISKLSQSEKRVILIYYFNIYYLLIRNYFGH